MIRLLFGILFLAFTVNAFAQFAGTGSIGPTFNRREPFIGGQASGGGSPITSPCTGAADFSDGCAIAIFGH